MLLQSFVRRPELLAVSVDVFHLWPSTTTPVVLPYQFGGFQSGHFLLLRSLCNYSIVPVLLRGNLFEDWSEV